MIISIMETETLTPMKKEKKPKHHYEAKQKLLNRRHDLKLGFHTSTSSYFEDAEFWKKPFLRRPMIKTSSFLF